MGRTLTYYVLTSSAWIQSDSGTRITNTSGSQLILDANEFPTKMTISGQISRVPTVNGNGIVYICTDDGNNSYAASPSFYITCSADGTTTMTHTNPAWKTFSGTNLKGKGLAVKVSNGGYHHGNRWEVKIYTQYIIDAPTGVSVPTSTSGITAISFTYSNPQDGVIDCYEIQARDRMSASNSWGSWFTLTTFIPPTGTSSTGTALTVSPNTAANQAQRQYRIRAVGTDTAYNSDWTVSNTVTYLANGPVAVLRREIIKASTAKTYEI